MSKRSPVAGRSRLAYGRSVQLTGPAACRTEGIGVALADTRDDRQARQRFGMERMCRRAPSSCFGPRRMHRRCWSRTTRWPDSHLAYRMARRFGMRWTHGCRSTRTTRWSVSQLGYCTGRCFFCAL